VNPWFIVGLVAGLAFGIPTMFRLGQTIADTGNNKLGCAWLLLCGTVLGLVFLWPKFFG